jgi:cell division protein FtsQ
VSYAGGGYTVRVSGYPELRFGAPDRLQSKWAAASRILKDPSVAGASYVDLRVPERPAVGPSTGSEEGFIP